MEIEVGKYYRAENGDKVGPMEKWANLSSGGHAMQIEGGTYRYDGGGDIWRIDGTSNYGMPVLVAEWIDP